MDAVSLIGFVAGTFTTVAFLPQLVRIWRTKSAHDISLLMYIIICSGIFLWLVYGILIDSFPVIVANTVTLAIASAILVLKVRYSHGRE